jgi:hypothetical protein
MDFLAADAPRDAMENIHGSPVFRVGLASYMFLAARYSAATL